VRPFIVKVISPLKIMCAAPMRGCEPGKTRLGRLPKRRYGKIPLAPIASQFFLVHALILTGDGLSLPHHFVTSLAQKTAAPFPRRWGLPRKGRAVFRREDCAYSKPLRKTCFSRKSVFRQRQRLTAPHPAARFRMTLCYSVVRRNRKERCIRLRALDIRQRIGRLPGPGIAPVAHHHRL
jgi:hypothetical protein